MSLLSLVFASITLPFLGGPQMSAGELESACLAGINGDRGRGVECIEYIDFVADDIAKPAGEDGKDLERDNSPCLFRPDYDSRNALWAYLDWIRENPSEPAADARIPVTSALLSKWPCGWRT